MSLEFTNCSQFVGKPLGTCSVHEGRHTDNQYSYKVCHFTYNTYHNVCREWNPLDFIEDFIEALNGDVVIKNMTTADAAMRLRKENR